MNGDREFERLRAQRDLSWKQMLRAMGDALVVRGSGVVPTEEEPAASQYAFDLAGALAAPEFQARRETLRDVREQDDLIGASRIYGIPGAEGMHLADLQEALAERREMVREQNETVSLLRALYEGAATAVGLGLTSLPKEALRLYGNWAEHFAFLGESIARSEEVREADRWLAMLQEGLTADLPEERRALARGVAGAIGMFAPAALTWQLAGAVGALPGLARIGKAITPVGRVMVRGMATEATLQDPTAPLQEQAINLGLGAAFGLGDLGGTVGRTITGAGIGAMAGALADDGDPLTMMISAGAGAVAFGLGGAALSKVQRSFPSRTQWEYAGYRPPRGPTIDAAFIAPDGLTLGAGPGTGLARVEPPPPPGTALTPFEAPLANAYPRPGEPEQLRGLLGLPPGPQEGSWSLVNPLQEIGQPQQGALSAGEPWWFAPMREQGLQPDRTFNHYDLNNPSIREAIQADPTLTLEQKELVLRTGSLKPIALNEAASEAAQLTKQETILESPALAELSGHAVLDDASVARALVESYPGQIGIVQNVQDVAGTLRKILMEQMPSGVGPQDFRVVTRRVREFPVETVVLSPEGEMVPGVIHSEAFGEVLLNRGIDVPSLEDDEMFSILQSLYGGIEGLETASGFRSNLGRYLSREEASTLAEFEGFRGDPQLHSSDIFSPRSQTDILVSSGKPISNKTVAEYEQFGMFSGQRARLASGQEVVVESLSSDFSRVRPLHGGESVRVTTHQILPMKSSQVVDDIPGLYEDFASFARVRLDKQSRQAGILPFELLSNEGATQAPLLMEEYIKGMGVDPRSYYGASLRWLMEQKHIEALRELAPADERAVLKELQAEYRQLVEERGLPEPTLDDLAQARGFVRMYRGQPSTMMSTASPRWFTTEKDVADIYAQYGQGRTRVPHGQLYEVDVPLDVAQASGYGSGGFGPDALLPGEYISKMRPVTEPVILSDTYSKGEVEVEFENEAAAREFLHGIQREPIDDSPVGHVPLEVMEQPLGYSMIGGQTPGVYRDADHWLEQTSEFLQDLEPTPAPPGSVPPGGLPPIIEPPLLPEGDDPFGSAFEAANRNHPAAYRKALGKLDSLLSRAFLPMRNYIFRVDNLLRPLGVPSFEPLWTALSNAHNRMVSESFPWERQYFDVIGRINRRVRRDGTLWEIMNSEVSQWQLLMDGAGLSVDERQAVIDLQDLFIRFDIDEVIDQFPDIAQRESFVNHFRRFEEALPGESPGHPRKATFGPAGAEQQGVNWVAEKNMDAIGARYFRSFYKVKHMNTPYEMMRAATADPRVPQVIKDGVGKWAETRMWGFDPSKDIVIKGAHSILNKLAGLAGQRLSIGEVSALLHAEISVGYHAALGGTPSVIIRDMPQAFVGAMQVGLGKAAPILTRLMRDKEYRHAAFELAFDAGWATPGHGMAVDPDIFGGSAFSTLQPGREITLTQQPFVERTVDWFSDHVANRLGLSGGLQGSWADTLRLYGSLSDFWRIWNGMSGYDSAWKALAKYDAGKLYQRAPIEELERELLDNSSVARFQGPIQDGFLEFVRRGDFEGAARYFGGKVADNQIRYGMNEHPQTWRNLGPQAGRRAMKYLSFNSQMLANFGQIIADPRITAKNKVAYLGQVGTMQAMFAIGTAYTGWNLTKMGLTGIVSGFAGTGLFDMVNDVQRGLAFVGLMDPASGPTPDESALMAAGRRGYGSQLLTTDPTQASWNLWAGALRTAGNLAESAQWGGEAVLRTLVTGQSGDPSVERRQLGLEPYGTVGLLPEDQSFYPQNPQPGGSQ